MPCLRATQSGNESLPYNDAGDRSVGLAGSVEVVTVRSGGGLAVNFQALHVLVWHTAVVPVSAAAGALLG